MCIKKLHFTSPSIHTASICHVEKLNKESWPHWKGFQVENIELMTIFKQFLGVFWLTPSNTLEICPFFHTEIAIESLELWSSRFLKIFRIKRPGSRLRQEKLKIKGFNGLIYLILIKINWIYHSEILYRACFRIQRKHQTCSKRAPYFGNTS